MHCCFSGDSEADPEDMILAAIQKGLDGLCFTDHFDYDYQDDPELFLLDFPSYKEKIFSLKEKYKDNCNIRWGIEIGLQPHIVQVNNDVTAKYPFDFVIGSSHVVHGIAPYYPHYYDGRSEDEAYLEYFESILENLHTNVDFDVYGHLDYVVRYGKTKDAEYSYQKYQDVIDPVLEKIIDLGKGIELNTGAIRYGLKELNPCNDILRRYRQLGGEIITVGSDAHEPKYIADGFDRAAEVLKECGFHYYTTFDKRIPEFHKL